MRLFGSVLLFLLTLAPLSGCIVSARQVVRLGDGHYVIVNDDSYAFDCYSAPVGDDWRPTCVRVDYSKEVPGWVRSRYSTIGANNPAADRGAPDDTDEKHDESP